MFKKYSDSLFNEFLNYLRSLGVSENTLKFYKSDLNHFIGWLLLHLRTFGVLAEELRDTIPFLNPKAAKEYLHYMLSNNIPTKTVNRRLSTLRHLSRFLLSSQILDFDFASDLTNYISKQVETFNYENLVSQFKKHLELEKASPITIKNYLSDIKQFIAWLEKNAGQTSLTNN